jgi:hypothetical protein
MSIRFHLDEHISDSIAADLRRRGVNVTTTADAGLAGADDATQLAFAASAGRPQQSLSIGEMLPNLTLIYDLLSEEEMSNRIEYL